MAFWLIKSEPSVYSIGEFARERRTLWDGVRNYQARNFLKSMQPGDSVLFYHSSCEEAGVVGLARVKHAAVPDPLQFEPGSDYFDSQATPDAPRWWSPEVEWVMTFPKPVTIAKLRSKRELEKMMVLQRGSRLSVQPVTDKEFQIVVSISEGGEKFSQPHSRQTASQTDSKA